MSEIDRVSPTAVKEKLISGKALLVCAYDNQDKFRRVHLEGAISLAEFRERISSLSRDTEIVFYCA